MVTLVILKILILVLENGNSSRGTLDDPVVDNDEINDIIDNDLDP